MINAVINIASYVAFGVGGIFGISYAISTSIDIAKGKDNIALCLVALVLMILGIGIKYIFG